MHSIIFSLEQGWSLRFIVYSLTRADPLSDPSLRNGVSPVRCSRLVVYRLTLGMFSPISIDNLNVHDYYTTALLAHHRNETGHKEVKAIFEDDAVQIAICAISVVEFARRPRPTVPRPTPHFSVNIFLIRSMSNFAERS